MVSYLQCNKITLLESQARSAFFGAWDRIGRYKICVTNCPNGFSFLLKLEK